MFSGILRAEKAAGQLARADPPEFRYAGVLLKSVGAMPAAPDGGPTRNRTWIKQKSDSETPDFGRFFCKISTLLRCLQKVHN